MDLGLTALGALIAGSVVAVALAGFKALERALVRKKGEPDSWTAKDREKLNNVATIVSRCDSEGVPMAYVPRRLLRLAETQTELMRSIVALVEKQTSLSQALHDHLTAHESREEAELVRIREAIEKKSA